MLAELIFRRVCDNAVDTAKSLTATFYSLAPVDNC